MDGNGNGGKPILTLRTPKFWVEYKLDNQVGITTAIRNGCQLWKASSGPRKRERDTQFQFHLHRSKFNMHAECCIQI